jgi:7,8-dihydro-6-hydroxymethylpterin-pyrophosphokinase
VLVPLTDLAPDFVHPALGLTIEQLKDAVDTSEITMYYD